MPETIAETERLLLRNWDAEDLDDIEKAREAIVREGLEVLPGRGLDFRDPWGNHIQVVDYRRIQFERTRGVKRALGIAEVEKSGDAQAEIAERGLGRED